MFKISGTLAGKKATVTWDAGKVDHPQLAKVLEQEIAARDGRYSSASQQACEASMDDPLFCYEILASMFSEIDAFEGDCGLITFEGDDDIVY